MWSVDCSKLALMLALHNQLVVENFGELIDAQNILVEKYCQIGYFAQHCESLNFSD